MATAQVLATPDKPIAPALAWAPGADAVVAGGIVARIDGEPSVLPDAMHPGSNVAWADDGIEAAWSTAHLGSDTLSLDVFRWDGSATRQLATVVLHRNLNTPPPWVTWSNALPQIHWLSNGNIMFGVPAVGVADGGTWLVPSRATRGACRPICCAMWLPAAPSPGAAGDGELQAITVDGRPIECMG